MRKIIGIFVVLGILLATSSCKKNLYDIDMVKQSLQLTFHNDSVDKTHTWSLMDDYTIKVTANVTDVDRIEVLSVNPYAPNNKSVELLATQEVDEEGDVITLVYSVPTANDSVYVAAVTDTEEYKVVAVKKGTESIDFSNLNTTNEGTVTVPTIQEVYYCFCCCFPQPSTNWGFNDLVYRISKEVISDNVLRINVTLSALGSTNQMAGALRLDGISYDNDVDNIKISNGNTFCKYTDSKRQIIKEEDVKLKGQDGSVVINLFDDAHKAFYVRTEDNGKINRYYINVSHTTDKSHLEFSPVTVSYDITFKNNNTARNITFGKIDPFILYYYNSNIWETHKYSFKFKEILYDYLSGSPESYDTGFSWALEIPYKWFRWPLQGTSMGSYKKKVIYGAYQQPYHSFGEWGTNKTVATDWYLYPSMSVY